MSREIMKWVALLPEVGAPILNKRAGIIRTMDEAAELEKRAAELRSEAYAASLSLESEIRRIWSDAEINQAKDSAH